MIKNIGKALILLLLLNLLLILPSFAGEKSDSGVAIPLDAYSTDNQGQKSVDKKAYNENIQFKRSLLPGQSPVRMPGTCTQRSAALYRCMASLPAIIMISPETESPEPVSSIGNMASITPFSTNPAKRSFPLARRIANLSRPIGSISSSASPAK